MSGRITDPTGQTVAGVAVRLVRDGTRTTLDTVTNEAGYYFFPNLQPGTYEVRVSQDGFKSIQRDGVTVATADRQRLDFRLELGAVTETVTVTADASLLQVGSAEVATTVTARDYERLPQIQFNRMRSPATFLYLSPGVLGNVNNNGRDNVAASNQIQVNGSAKFSNELYMDGLPGRTNFNETAPPVDAVGEFKLQANQLSAEYGNTGSAVVTFTVKSGTNDFHGLLFDIFRNEKLDARSFLAPTRSTIRQNEFGATFGGPVLLPGLYNGKDRTFFFFAYTGSRKRGLDQIQRRRLPTPDERLGDFSGNTRLIYDPATTRSEGTRFIRTPFPGNVIPGNRLDPVALRVTELLPPLNLSGAGVLNFQDFIGERLLDPDVYLTRIDHSFAPSHRVFGTYNHTRIPRQNVTAAMADPFSDRTFQFITSHMIRGNYDWVAAPTVLNNLLVGFNQFRNPFRGFYANQGFAERFGIRGAVGDAFPSFGFTDGYAPLGRNSLSDSTESSFIVKNIANWTRGAHVFKFGVEYRQNLRWSEDQNASAGAYSFNNLGTALPTSPNNTGDAYASFLLGQVHSATLNLPFTSRARKPYWGFFVQDDVRLTPKLTLNLGVRYEITQAPWELDDQYSLVDLSTPNPAAGGRPGASVFAGSGQGRTGSSRLTDTGYDAFGPRVGFAWQLTSRTVLRGGYGLFYADNGIFPVTTGFRTIAGFQTLDQGITPPFVLSQGFPGGINPNPALEPGLLNGQNVTSRSGTMGLMPRTQNWSLSVQRELSRNWAMELSYVANRNTRQTAAGMINENQVHPRYLALGGLLTQNINSAAAREAGFAPPYPGFNGSVAQALRTYPQYLNITEQSAKAGTTFYNGFSARIRKRYSAGFTVDAHYTLSRNMGYADAGAAGFGTTNNMLQDNFNRQLEYALLPNDVPHAFVVQYSYELPFGPGKPLANTGVARHLLGGWILNAIHRYQCGVPLPILMNNSLPLFNRVLRPDIVSGTNLATGIAVGDFEPNSDRRINPEAFRNPAPFTFGSAGPAYHDLRQFPVLTEDFSILKNTNLTERFSVETSAQFINALNRHRFTDINVNFTNPAFGRASGSNIGRIITLGLKLKF
ncbi:MAG: TonB-dependent receptor [Bryobacterales bacterium]|nr:TonB-dependent receptor [Bryobacterales bacterium]